jgi:hypothetical protein
MKAERIQTKHGAMVVERLEPKKPEKRLRPISALTFEMEVRALTRLFNAKLITAAMHKQRYDLLVERLGHGGK